MAKEKHEAKAASVCIRLREWTFSLRVPVPSFQSSRKAHIIPCVHGKCTLRAAVSFTPSMEEGPLSRLGGSQPIAGFPFQPVSRFRACYGVFLSFQAVVLTDLIKLDPSVS